MTDQRLLDDVLIALNTLGQHPQKSRGQNFLVSEEISRSIAAAESGGDLPRLEIGAGLGSLSMRLAEYPGELHLLEIDPHFAQRLQDILSDRSDTFVHTADALAFDYAALFGDMPYRIYGNIPYNITSPLVQRLLISGSNWQSMVLMVQKEAALRLCRGKGRENGPLSLMVEYFGGGELILDVPKNAFYPAPAVDSAVICIKRKEGSSADEAFRKLFCFIDAAFSLRRKTMINSFSSIWPQYSKAYWQELLEECGLSPSIRAEACDLRTFSELFALHERRSARPAAQPPCK